jgi:hypothetical protein
LEVIGDSKSRDLTSERKGEAAKQEAILAGARAKFEKVLSALLRAKAHP